MKKLGLLFKEISESYIKNTLKESHAVLIVRYSGLSSPDLSTLRQNLKNSNATLFVIKNSAARRALQDSELDFLTKAIEGPCGLIFVKEEPVAASRILYNFSKEHEQLIFETGLFKDKILERKDIESMARLPSKEILRAQLVMTFNTPISGLAIALNKILTKLVYCLDQIRQKKTNLK